MTDHFRFAYVATALDESLVSCHQARLRVFYEEERVWQVLEQLPHAAWAYVRQPLIAFSSGKHDVIIHKIYRIHTCKRRPSLV